MKYDRGSLDWLDYLSLRPKLRLHAGKNDRGVLYTREGMAIHARRLVLVPEDGPSRAFIFDIGEQQRRIDSPTGPRIVAGDGSLLYALKSWVSLLGSSPD